MTIIAGNLPPGLTQSGNLIIGRPTVARTVFIDITATNAGGTQTKTLTLPLSAALMMLSTSTSTIAGSS